MAKTSIRRLAAIKAEFGPASAREKVQLIQSLAVAKFRSVADLMSYHESICYLRAYADSQELLQLVDDELDHFDRRLRQLKRPLGKTSRLRLERSGIVGTDFTHDCGYQVTKWILQKFPTAADFDYAELRKLKGDPILDLLPALVTWNENDAVDDPYLSTADIRDADIGSRRITPLQWFLNLYRRLPADENLKRLLFDKIAFSLRVAVGKQPFAITNSREPVGDYYFQREPLQRGYPELRRELRRHRLTPKLLDPVSGRKIIDRARMALLVRRRELWPLSFANEQEVWSAAIGRGTTVYLIGMLPETRLPLEANYSALLIRNGVPIGYGVAAMVGERLELAINVFDTFRRCEAAFIYTNFLRLLHQLFGCSYLVVRRYQVGYDNPEGLQSGAYWFYYKLGFRSLDADLRRLAEAEAARIAARRGYRTPLTTLKRLAESDLCLNLHRASDFSDRDFALGQIALAQTRLISRAFAGDRDLARREAQKSAKKLLAVRSMAGWSKLERLWFERWSVLICALPEVARWSTAEKQALVNLIRAKGYGQEQTYVRAVRDHSRLLRALRALAGSRSAE